ncbi:MAG: aldo/keto reductase [Spirochaetaceae bacterium]|nr:MAG: aldo/keto reductase [Spirochaetaceae bacterium]
MEYREIGSTGIKTSPVCLGTWAIGGGPWWGASDDKESIRAIQAALDEGINFIDTAPAYGFGRSEEIVGSAIAGRRDSVVIATKCGLWWSGTEGEPFFEMDGYDVRRSLKPETIRAEVEQSLKRIGTDYIDLLITHWQEPGPDKTPIEVTMDCLEQLRKEGKIRAIGASNLSPEELVEYTRHGTLDVIQEHYSMLHRDLEKTHRDLALRDSVGIMAYTVLEQGLLSGKITMDSVFEKDEFRNQIPWFQPDKRAQVIKLLESWKGLTEKYDCTPAQLVIAWTFSQPGITWAVSGARKVSHALENARAAELVLEDADVTYLRESVESLEQ